MNTTNTPTDTEPELADPIEAGQIYRWASTEHPEVEIREIYITEDGETQIRIWETDPEGARSQTVDAEGFIERVRDGRLDLVGRAFR